MELFDVPDIRPTTARLQFQKAYEHLQLQISENHSKNRKAYERFERIKNNSMIGATDLQGAMRGVIRKVEFTVRFLIDQCLKESCGQLSIICKEQGLMLEKVSEEIKRNVNDMFILLKNVYPSVQLIIQEKNNFAEKALTLAKALRSLHENSTPSQFRFMSVSIDVMNIVNNVALQHGFTGYEIYQKLLYYLQTNEAELIYYSNPEVEAAENAFWCTEAVLCTLESCYTTKLSELVSQHVIDVITAVRNKQRIIEEKRREEEEKERLRQLKAEEETKKIYDEWKRLQQLEIIRIMKAKNKVDINEAAEHAVNAAERLSDQEIAHRLFLRRAYCAGLVQMMYRKHRLYKRIQFRVHTKMSYRISRFLHCIALHSILYRRIQRTRRVKRAIAMITRICLQFVIRLRQIKWASLTITKSLKRLYEQLKMRRARRAMIRASQYKIDFEYKYQINVLEKRLERLETIISNITPSLVCEAAEQWLDKNSILQDTKRYDKMVLPYTQSEKENVHNKAITDVVNMEDRVNMLNVAIQSSYRLAQLQSTLLNTSPKFETQIDSAVQCELLVEPAELAPEPVKKRVTIRSPRKVSIKPTAPKAHKPSQRPRLQAVSSDVELHSDEENTEVPAKPTPPATILRNTKPAATLAEEVERIVKYYSKVAERPPVILPQTATETSDKSGVSTKLTAPAGLVRRMEELKKRSNAMVVGITQTRREFDGVGIG